MERHLRQDLKDSVGDHRPSLSFVELRKGWLGDKGVDKWHMLNPLQPEYHLECINDSDPTVGLSGVHLNIMLSVKDPAYLLWAIFKWNNIIGIMPSCSLKKLHLGVNYFWKFFSKKFQKLLPNCKCRRGLSKLGLLWLHTVPLHDIGYAAHPRWLKSI